MKTALITGASSGIGEAFARRLAADGFDLILAARSESKLSALAEQLTERFNINARFFALDLIESTSRQMLFEETRRLGVDVDLLINNAGFGSMGDFVNLDRENELDIVRLNVLALVDLTHRFLGPMRERCSGSIINVSSAAGFQPIPFFSTYAASKAFVTSFTEAIAEENRPMGVRLIAVCPGPTETNFFNASKIEDPQIIKGLQTPEEVVETAMKALNRGKSRVISGWTNVIGALLGTYVPSALSARVISRSLRSKYQP